MTSKLVLMNDTSTRYHHGCARVMRLLRQGLEARGAEILYSSPARHEWARDDAFLRALDQATGVVINGEGTLHHGADHGARLLSVADHPLAKGKKLCLVNALFDQNPESWRAQLEKFALVSARDSDSAAQLSNLLNRSVGWVPDLSLSAPSEAPQVARHGVILGDSVRLSQRQALAKSAHRFEDLTFVPTKTLRAPVWRAPLLAPILKTVLYWGYNAHFTLTPPRFEMPMTEQDYLARIAGTGLHVTGRFHAVCLSLLAETPFLAVTSTSGKIEKLLRDLGLDTHRIVTGDALQAIDPTPGANAFTSEETARLRVALADAQDRAAALLDEVVA
ncbi:polysaccharide pyruvyl transferase family protein [Shimia biformata]|uniref:polysaccharide pyruvyl transferase family protein n=1 Tax=Shimia biformata TaxID=1294299 RepID=UPI00194FBD13|nr:polysaccharide pyruvyl transferase family protein [Shimia biformata]